MTIYYNDKSTDLLVSETQEVRLTQILYILVFIAESHGENH